MKLVVFNPLPSRTQLLIRFFGLQGIWVMRRIVHTNVSTREVLKIILFLYVVLFVVSIPWNWMALYQQVGSIMQNTICALSLSLYL